MHNRMIVNSNIFQVCQHCTANPSSKRTKSKTKAAQECWKKGAYWWKQVNVQSIRWKSPKVNHKCTGDTERSLATAPPLDGTRGYPRGLFHQSEKARLAAQGSHLPIGHSSNDQQAWQWPIIGEYLSGVWLRLDVIGWRWKVPQEYFLSLVSTESRDSRCHYFSQDKLQVGPS